MSNKFLTFLVLAVLVGCASSPESDPAYVSPDHYSSYNCKQINAEMRRVSAKMDQAEKSTATGQVLETALAAYAISRGESYYSDNDPQHRRLVNQYDVLEQTSIEKECNL